MWAYSDQSITYDFALDKWLWALWKYISRMKRCAHSFLKLEGLIRWGDEIRGGLDGRGLGLLTLILLIWMPPYLLLDFLVRECLATHVFKRLIFLRFTAEVRDICWLATLLRLPDIGHRWLESVSSRMAIFRLSGVIADSKTVNWMRCAFRIENTRPPCITDLCHRYGSDCHKDWICICSPVFDLDHG